LLYWIVSIGQMIGRKLFVGVVIFVSLIILGGVLLFYRHDSLRLREAKIRDLYAVATYKTQQIMEWRREKIGNVVFFTTSPLSKNAFKQWAEKPDSDIVSQINGRSAIIQEQQGFEHVFAISADKQRFVYPGRERPEITPSVFECIDSSIRYKKLFISKFHLGSETHKPIIAITAPVIDYSDRVLSVMLFYINPNDYLYSIVEAWPGGEKTTESLLACSDGDTLVVLNYLKQGNERGAKVPRNFAFDTHARKVPGYENIYEGEGKDGGKILVVFLPIPHTDWYMLNVISHREVFADLYYRAVFFGVFFLTLTAGLAITTYLFLREQKSRMELVEKTSEVERHFNNSIDMHCVADHEGLFKILNPQWSKTLGYSIPEMVGKPFIEFVHPDDVPSTLAVVSKLTSGSPVPGFVNRCRHKDGSYRWIEWQSYPERGLIYASARDVTSRVLAEEELKRNEVRLKSMVNILQNQSKNRQEILDMALHEAIQLTGSEIGYIYYYNERNQEFTLNSWSKSVMEACSVVDPQTCYELSKTGIWGEAVRQRKPIIVNDFCADNPLKKGYPEGHVALSKFLTTPVFLNGEIVAVIGVANKTTDYNDTDVLQLTLLMDSTWKVIENINKEQALRASEQLFAEIINLSPDMMGVARLADGKILMGNPSLTTIMGYAEAEYLGRTAIEMNWWANPDDRKQMVQMLQQDGIINNLEIRLRNRQGDVLTCLLSAHVLDMNNETCFIFIVHDITQRKLAEEKIKQLANLHQTILDAVSVGILYVKDRKNQWANSAFYRMYGFKPEDISGLDTIVLYANQEDYHRVGAEGYTSLRDGQVYTTQVLAKRADGTTFWIDLNGKALDPANPQGGSIWMLLDIDERKRAEEALRSSEEKFRSIVENSLAGIFTIDDNYHFVYANEEFCRITGYSQQELTGMDFRRLISETSMNAVVNNYIRRRNGEPTPSRYELEIVGKHGDVRQAEITVTLIRDSKNRLRSMGQLMDITERKRSEKELLETQERLQSFMNSATDLFFIWDRNLCLVELNSTALRYFPPETTKGMVIGRGLLEFLTYLSDTGEYQKYLDVLQTGQPYYGESKVSIGGNDSIWFSTRIFRVGDGLGVVSTDITEWKMAEMILRDRDAKLKSVFRAAPVAIGLTIDRVIQECNDSMYQITGYSPEELIGRSSRMLYLSDEEFQNPLGQQTQLDIHRGAQSAEVKWRRKDGSVVNIILNLLPLDATDASKGTIFTALDITERIKAENEIRQLNAELERKVEERTVKLQQANKDLEAFAYSVSHDLRAPLRHIDGFLRLMYSSIPSPSGNTIKYYEQIISASRRMSAMIDDLLSFSRLGRKELVKTDTDLAQLIDEVIEQLKPEIALRDVEWRVQPLPHVLADRNLIKLAFENLLSNAIKYTAGRPTAIIEIGCNTANQQYHEIYVKDNGVGFDMAYSGKLFGVFQRLHSAEDFEGTGIGLANVKQIVEKHGGYVRADGKKNEGAIFFVYLPK